MKKYLIALVLFGLCFGFIQQQHIAVIGKKNSSGGTDYTADANCMGAWYMNSAGDAAEVDRSGEGNNLGETSGDTIAQSSDVPSSYSGNSKDLESTETEYLYHADGLDTDINGANQSITFAAWIKPENDTTANMYIVSKWDNADGSRQYSLFYSDSNDRFQCNISNDGADWTESFGTTGISYATWVHIACVYNDTDVRLYVNGVLDSNGADNPAAHTTGIFNGDQSFRVGGENADLYFDGLIDEVIIFDRALDAFEILEMYNFGISGNRGAND